MRVSEGVRADDASAAPAARVACSDSGADNDARAEARSEARANTHAAADDAVTTIALDGGVSLEQRHRYGLPERTRLRWRDLIIFPVDCSAASTRAACATCCRDYVEKTTYLQIVDTIRRSSGTLYIFAGQAPGNTMCANLSAWSLDVQVDRAEFALVTAGCFQGLRVLRTEPSPLIEIEPDPASRGRSRRLRLDHADWHEMP